MAVAGLQNRKKLVGSLIGLLVFMLLRWQTVATTIWVNAGMVEINHLPAWRSILFDIEAPEMTYVQQAVQHHPHNAALWRGWGMLRFAQGQTNEALAIWQRAGLDAAQVAVYQGHYANAVGRGDAAQAWYEYATTLDPDLAIAWHELGNLRQSAGQLDEAREAYARAWALGYADSADPLAKIWRDSGAYETAVEIWLSALHTLPGHRDRLRWWYGLTNSLRVTGQWETGVNMAKAALAEFPEDARLYVEYGAMHYGNNGDLHAAMEALNYAIELDDTLVAAYSVAAGIMASENQYAAAYEWYSRAAEKEPNNPSWYVAQGNMARAAGNLPLALDLFKQAIVRFPEFSAAHYGIALVYQQLGEKESAINAITQALKLMERQDAQRYLRAGEIYEWGGNPEAAVTMYQKVLDIDPDNEPAMAALQRLLDK